MLLLSYLHRGALQSQGCSEHEGNEAFSLPGVSHRWRVVLCKMSTERTWYSFLCCKFFSSFTMCKSRTTPSLFFHLIHGPPSRQIIPSIVENPSYFKPPLYDIIPSSSFRALPCPPSLPSFPALFHVELRVTSIF